MKATKSKRAGVWEVDVLAPLVGLDASSVVMDNEKAVVPVIRQILVVLRAHNETTKNDCFRFTLASLGDAIEDDIGERPSKPALTLALERIDLFSEVSAQAF